MADHEPDFIKTGFRIGEWQIRPMMNRISDGETSLVLEPKVMDVLVCLAKSGGDTVTKEQFMADVWGGTVVTDDVLSRCISELRKALDDDWRDPHVIETIRKTGYRLVSPVVPISGDEPPPGDAGKGEVPETEVPETEVPETEVKEAGVPEAEAANGDPETFRPSRPKPVVRTALIATIVVLVGILVAMQLRTDAEPAPPTPIPFTSAPGLELDATISPDGRQVAFASDNGSGRDLDIYIAQEGAELPLRLTDDPADERHPVWSPDGLRLAFVRDTSGTPTVLIVPSIGGSPRRVATFENRVVHDIAWAPEGRLIAIAAESSPFGPSAVYVISEDSLDVKQLTFPPPNSEGARSIAFSPTGERLAFVRAVADDVQDVFLVSTVGGEPRQVSFDSTMIGGLDWAGRGEDIVFASIRNGASGLWRISASGGATRWIVSSSGGSRLEHPSVSRTGGRLIYVEKTSDTNLWRLWRQDESGPYRAHPLIFSTRWDSHPDISPDGERIAYASDQSGQTGIWVCDRTGANHVQLTQSDGARNDVPRWSPDGSEIAFLHRRQGRTEIRIVGASGGGTTSLPGSPRHDAVPIWSRDGSYVYFASDASGRPEVWRAPRDSGATVQITRDGGLAAIESADGRSLYYVRPDTAGIWRISPTGDPSNSPQRELIVDTLEPDDLGNWRVMQDGIYHIRRERRSPALMFYSFDSAESSVVAPLRNIPQRAGLAVAPDRSWIVVTQDDDVESDIMLMAPFE